MTKNGISFKLSENHQSEYTDFGEKPYRKNKSLDPYKDKDKRPHHNRCGLFLYQFHGGVIHFLIEQLVLLLKKIWEPNEKFSSLFNLRFDSNKSA